MWNVIGKIGSNGAQKNVHYAQFSGHKDLNSSFMVTGVIVGNKSIPKYAHSFCFVEKFMDVTTWPKIREIDNPTIQLHIIYEQRKRSRHPDCQSRALWTGLTTSFRLYVLN